MPRVHALRIVTLMIHGHLLGDVSLMDGIGHTVNVLVLAGNLHLAIAALVGLPIPDVTGIRLGAGHLSVPFLQPLANLRVRDSIHRLGGLILHGLEGIPLDSESKVQSE